MLFEKDLTCIFDFQRGHRGSDYDALEHAFGKWMDIEISIDRFYVPEKAITVEMEQEATRAHRSGGSCLLLPMLPPVLCGPSNTCC